MDLISVLVLLYTVSGETYESEMPLRHASCMMAQTVLSRAIDEHRAPKVETFDGSKHPLARATCVAACFADAPPGEWKIDIHAALRSPSDEEAEG